MPALSPSTTATHSHLSSISVRSICAMMNICKKKYAREVYAQALRRIRLCVRRSRRRSPTSLMLHLPSLQHSTHTHVCFSTGTPAYPSAGCFAGGVPSSCASSRPVAMFGCGAADGRRPGGGVTAGTDSGGGVPDACSGGTSWIRRSSASSDCESPFLACAC